MPGKTRLVLLISAFLLTTCKNYAGESITYHNGLSCRNYVDYRFFEWRGEEYRFYVREEGANCSYLCPNASAAQIDISGSISSLYAASAEELDAQFCGVVVASTSTPSATPVTALSPTATSSPTRAASAIVEITAEPLLSETISMCDLGGKLINFRILESAPDLSGQTLTVQIADHESACYVNPTNPSLLTCLIPNNISFPASIVVTLDGVVVNDFVYSGLGCAILTTPTPAKIRSYP